MLPKVFFPIYSFGTTLPYILLKLSKLFASAVALYIYIYIYICVCIYMYIGRGRIDIDKGAKNHLAFLLPPYSSVRPPREYIVHLSLYRSCFLKE